MRLRTLLPPNRRFVRRVLGLLWLLDGVLQLQPQMFTADWWDHDLAGSAMGQPEVVRHSILWAVGLVARNPAAWNTGFACLQAAIGLALLTGRWERLAIAASVPWALGVWWIGEGLGMLPAGFATLASGSPGPVLLYPLIGLLAWPGQDGGPVAQRPARGAWLLLWAGQSVLQMPLVHPVGQVLTANAHELSGGRSGWAGVLAATHPHLLAAVLACTQVAVGLGVVPARHRRFAVVAGAIAAVVYWVGFQYLGGIGRGGATDPSSGPLLLLLASSLWPGPASASLEFPQLPVSDEMHAGAGGQHPQGVGGHGQVVIGHPRRPVRIDRAHLGRVDRRPQDHLRDARA